MYQIWNRRYTGSKFKLADWIANLIDENCKGVSFCDIFAGTGIISYKMLGKFKEIIINDFLFSNEIIYRAFFENKTFDIKKLTEISKKYCQLNASDLPDNYLSINFGNKFFSYSDAKKIGHIRENIEHSQNINRKEYNILIASLLYSADKVANTVGHYDAYIKGKEIKDSFEFELINPYINLDTNIKIYREDANDLAKKINSDIVYIDPPYNSRQYSRFYHVLENIAKWDKPKLYGEALKPEPENMSEYCRSNATNVFRKLVEDLHCKYIVVSYNNTYKSKSSSSRNKIEFNDLVDILSQKGELQIFDKEHQYFNAGKTEFTNHKEYIFIVKVGN